MAISTHRFGEVRPYLYHLTSSRNVGRILATGQLQSAENLLKRAGQGALVRAHRKDMTEVAIGSEIVLIRDQAPLHRGNVQLEEGWELSDLVEMLNGMVFFWPGWESKPIDYGVRHFERYEGEELTIIRAPFAEMLEANPGNDPLFCKYNSGSPRCTGGRPSPRSRETFLPAGSAPFNNSSVVEVTFKGAVNLPASVESSETPFGPWSRRVP